MSLIGGLVDSHHEMELTNSTRLQRSNWFVRHIGVIVFVGAIACVALVVAL